MVILEAVEANENSAIKYLDFSVSCYPLASLPRLTTIHGFNFSDCMIIFLFTNFQNMLVKTEFATIEERLKEQRKLRIKHEGILPEMHPKNGTYARLSAFRRDPIETFKKYAEFSGVNLHDVFNGGHRLRLDANEFKDLIRVKNNVQLILVVHITTYIT